MSEEALRVGIAGYGVVGTRRRQYIDSHPHMRTIAVCDGKFEGSGTLPDGASYHSNYSRLLEEDLDALFVSLPNYLAPEVTMAGLERGLHVFCEKPPGRTVQDVRDVMEVESRHPGLVLKYGFNHRYHDSVRETMRIIEDGSLGEIINLRGVYGKSKIIQFSGGWRSERRFSGGGILLDQGIHMVDLMRLVGGDFEQVKSFVSNAFWQHDVEDNAFAIMKDTRGRIAMLHSSATQWEHHFSLVITLTDGFLQLSGILSGSKSYGEETLTIGRRDESVYGTLRHEVIQFLDDNSWRDEIFEFADCIRNGNTPLYGVSNDALKTMQLVFRIYAADEEWATRFVADSPEIAAVTDVSP